MSHASSHLALTTRVFGAQDSSLVGAFQQPFVDHDEFLVKSDMVVFSRNTERKQQDVLR